MSDQWDEKAREMVYELGFDDPDAADDAILIIAAALRAAYGKGVEDSAGVAEAHQTGFPIAAETIAAAIRALKGDGK